MNIPHEKNIDRFSYVKGLLVMHKIKSTQIAQLLGITPTAVCLVVSGRQKSRRVMQKIAEMLDMPFEKVWGK